MSFILREAYFCACSLKPPGRSDSYARRGFWGHSAKMRLAQNG